MAENEIVLGEGEDLTWQQVAKRLGETRVDVLQYCLKHGHTPEQAMRHIAGDFPLDTPAQDLGWYEMQDLTPEDQALAWQQIKEYADTELRSGARAAMALDVGTPLDRARFLALRRSMIESWGPRNAMERCLVDQMAEAYTVAEHWNAIHLRQALFLDASTRDTIAKQAYLPLGAENPLHPPDLDDAHAMEQSAEMAERWHRMFLRNLRSLQDLRRAAPNVMVQHAEQINIGAQQVNANRP